MAEAIVSTLKAKIKANDEELQMFQDKWEICHHQTAIESIIHITDVPEYKSEFIKINQIKNHQNYQVWGHPHPAQHRDQGKGRVRSRGEEKLSLFFTQIFVLTIQQISFCNFVHKYWEGASQKRLSRVVEICAQFVFFLQLSAVTISFPWPSLTNIMKGWSFINLFNRRWTTALESWRWLRRRSRKTTRGDFLLFFKSQFHLVLVVKSSKLSQPLILIKIHWSPKRFNLSFCELW